MDEPLVAVQLVEPENRPADEVEHGTGRDRPTEREVPPRPEQPEAERPQEQLERDDQPHESAGDDRTVAPSPRRRDGKHQRECHVAREPPRRDRGPEVRSSVHAPVTDVEHHQRQSDSRELQRDEDRVGQVSIEERERREQHGGRSGVDEGRRLGDLG